MGNSLFNLFNGRQSGQNNINSTQKSNGQNVDIITEYQSLRQNPLNYLMRRRLNIPPEIQNNPQAIAQYFLNTGKMSQDQMMDLQNKIKSIFGDNVRF